MATGTPANGLPELAAIVIESAQRPGWRQRFAHPIALALAAAGHLGLLIAMLPVATDAVGDGGDALEAIAVSVVDRVPMMSVPAAQAAVSSNEAPRPDETPPEAPDTSQAEQLSLQPPPAPELSLPPEAEPLPDAITLPVKPPEPRADDERPLYRREIVLQSPPPSLAAPPPPASMPAASAAEASPGTVRAYERRVSTLLDAGKPGSRGLKGRLIVQFVIGAEGKPEHAVVLQSSGTPALDERVLAALQRLEFPPPPAAMTPQQLTFNVPYVYR